MPANQYIGKGSFLQLNDGSNNFKSIALCQSIGLTGLKRDFEDVTTHDTPTAFKDYLPKLIDAGEVKLDCLFDPASHKAQANNILTPTVGSYWLVWADFGTFNATVTVNSGTEIWTDGAATGLHTGQPLKLTSTGTLPAGCNAQTTYYAHVASGTTFTIHATNADACANTNPVNLTDTGTGTHTLKTSSKWAFSGAVSNIEPKAPSDGKLAASITVKITSSITNF